MTADFIDFDALHVEIQAHVMPAMQQVRAACEVSVDALLSSRTWYTQCADAGLKRAIRQDMIDLAVLIAQEGAR